MVELEKYYTAALEDAELDQQFGDDVMNEFTDERIRVLGGLGAVGRVQVRVLVDVVGLTVD